MSSLLTASLIIFLACSITRSGCRLVDDWRRRANNIIKFCLFLDTSPQVSSHKPYFSGSVLHLCLSDVKNSYGSQLKVLFDSFRPCQSNGMTMSGQFLKIIWPTVISRLLCYLKRKLCIPIDCHGQQNDIKEKSSATIPCKFIDPSLKTCLLAADK